MPKRDEQIEVLYNQHYTDLLRRACILLHDEEDARDAVGDVIARLMATDIQPHEEKLLAYVRSCVRFECLNRLKRMKLQERMRRALPLDDEAIDAHSEEEEEQYREFSFDLKSWFIINPTTKALVHTNYSGSNHWAFMYRGSNFAVNARLQKSFFKERLSCTLYANDIFRTSKTKMTTYYAIGLTDQDVYSYTQCVGLTLSYNFNVSHSKYKGSGAGNEEKSRL